MRKVEALFIDEKDIIAIHDVVSEDIQKQLEGLYPHLFESKQVEFDENQFNGNLPFLIGMGLCYDKNDVNKSLIVHPGYEATLETQPNGYQIIRFFKIRK